MSKKEIISIVALIFLLGGQEIVSAQALLPTPDIVFNPEFPGPNQEVTAAVDLSSFGQATARVTWMEDNVVKAEGYGLGSYVFKTGELGSKKTISLIIQTDKGNMVTRKVEVRPALVSLLWEGQSYTPPFFKGKPLFAYQGRVKFVAQPELVTNGVAEAPEKLIYQWFEDSELVPGMHGVGLNTYTVIGNWIIKPVTVRVVVRSLDGSLGASAVARISPVSPEVLLYEDHPLYGRLYNQALADNFNFNKDKDEITITAVPFYFDAVKQQDLRFRWSSNNSAITEGSAVTLAKPKETGGSSLVYLRVDHPAKLLQTIVKNIRVSF
jgi:hypothetical protein